jgi:hypothetical protein
LSKKYTYAKGDDAMTLQELENKKPPKVTIQEASAIMGVNPRFLQMGLQYNRFPFGTAVKMTREWAYYINTERFIRYMQGEDMKIAE